MGMTRVFGAALLGAVTTLPTHAQDLLPPLICEGVGPDWSLTMTPDEGEFTFAGPPLTMPIPQESRAEGRPFPRAYTLLGGRDTAIVILNERRCDTPVVTGWPYEANILTQKGEQPVILFGCCQPKE